MKLPVLPPDHRAALEVPEGGSMCANCKFYIADGNTPHGRCGEPRFAQWAGTDKIPLPADRYCSDWYEPAPGALRRDGLREPIGVTQRQDIIRREKGGWSVFSEGKPRKRLGGPYATREEAVKRLQQVEYFKHKDDPKYVPPPPQGSAPPTHALPPYNPQAATIGQNATGAAAPDPNTPPVVVTRADRALTPHPDHEEDLGRKFAKMARKLRAPYAKVVRAAMDSLSRTDSADRMDADVRGMLASARAAAERAIKQDEVEKLATRAGHRVAEYHKSQLRKDIKSAIGVDPVFKDKRTDARVRDFARENAKYIKRLPATLHDRVSELVLDAVASGRLTGGRSRSPDTLRQDLEDAFGMSETHAKVIARDQTAKLYSAINHDRQRDLGVTQFTWRTVGDQRVRDEHAELDGEVFDYDDPPEIDGEPTLPGDGVQCRCWADPVLDDLLDDDEGDDEDDDE